MPYNILFTSVDTKKNKLYLPSLSLYSSGDDKQIANNCGKRRSY